MEEKFQALLSMERDEESNKFLVKFSLAFFDFLEEVEKTVVLARKDSNADFECSYLAFVRELYSSTFGVLVMPYVNKLLEENENETL